MGKKGKGKGRKPPRYLWLVLALPLALLPGCAALDWFTGAGDPAAVDATGDGVPDASPAGRIIDTVKDSGLPYSETAAAVLAFLAGRYVTRRKKGEVQS